MHLLCMVLVFVWLCYCYREAYTFIWPPDALRLRSSMKVSIETQLNIFKWLSVSIYVCVYMNIEFIYFYDFQNRDLLIWPSRIRNIRCKGFCAKIIRFNISNVLKTYLKHNIYKSSSVLTNIFQKANIVSGRREVDYVCLWKSTLAATAIFSSFLFFSLFIHKFTTLGVSYFSQ